MRGIDRKLTSGLLHDRLNGDTNAVDDPLAFDEFEWLNVYINALAKHRERWINALDASTRY